MLELQLTPPLLQYSEDVQGQHFLPPPIIINCIHTVVGKLVDHVPCKIAGYLTWIQQNGQALAFALYQLFALTWRL